MWFRYNASRSGVTARPRGSGRAADKRVTNHDGWEFNGLPTLVHTAIDGNTLCYWPPCRATAEEKKRLFLDLFSFFDRCMDHNQVKQDKCSDGNPLLRPCSCNVHSRHNDMMINEKINDLACFFYHSWQRVYSHYLHGELKRLGDTMFVLLFSRDDER